jgi:dihydrolipoamide dehydrogenase
MAYGPTHQRSRSVAEASAKGVHYLMKKNKITELDGWGTLRGTVEDGKHAIEVTGHTQSGDGSKATYTCDNLIIATGAKVRMLPGMSVSDNVVTYGSRSSTPSSPARS